MSGVRMPLIAWVIAGAPLWGPAARAQTVTIGGVEMSASCPLAQGEHPRLLFERQDIPRLRERLSHPRLAQEVEHARQLAADGKAGAILLGVLYYLTGEREYIEQARAKLEPSWIQTYPLAADLVMGAMTPEEQRAEADKIVGIVKQERWRPHVVLDLAAWGHGQDEFLDGDLKERYKSDLVAGLAYNNLWSQGRGGSSMSHGYYGEHFYSEWFTMAVAWSNATGQDLVSQCDFAAHTPEYYIYHYRPWTPGLSVVHLGVNAMCSHPEALMPAKFEGENLAVLAAARFHDGLGQWWVDNVISRIRVGWSPASAGEGGVWGKLLWYDPDLPDVAPSQLPPARLFPENGQAVMRSDWTPAATYALFRCGRYGEIDGYWGRNNADNLHFIIGKQGILAADTGAVHGLNNAALAFAGTRDDDAWPHRTEYARQTIAHNSILVGSEPIEHLGWQGRKLGTVRAGGQSPIQDKSWWQLWGLPEPKPGDRPFKEGEIVAYETSPAFDYAAGDATHSYPPTRVRSITRQFVYLRPDTFVVFDRVVTAQAGLPITWLLHTLSRPRWLGSESDDTSVPPGKQLTLTPDGKSVVPNPHPGGRFLLTDGDTLVADDRWEGMNGRLFATVLLPQPDARIARLVGGPWHEFEVDGINYGPTEATYSSDQRERTRHDRENTIGVGGWRMEVTPKGEPTEANFLVVLLAADQQTEQAPATELMEAPGRRGVRVTVGRRACEVTFAASGPVGGHVAITEEGAKTVDRDLVQSVQDNYKQWSTDPRYETWMTAPEYRNFIGAQEVAEWAQSH
jgi:hypothetical protein